MLVCLGLLTACSGGLMACNTISTNKANEEVIFNDYIYEHGIKLTQIKKSGNNNNNYYSTATFTYSIYPNNAQNQHVRTSLTFDDNRIASSYLTVTVDEANKEITINALQAFDSLARLSIISYDNSSAYATVTIHMRNKLVCEWNDAYNYKMGSLRKKLVDSNGDLRFGSTGTGYANINDVLRYGYYGLNTENQTDVTYFTGADANVFKSFAPVTGYSETDCITDVNFSSNLSSTYQTYVKQRLYDAVEDWFYLSQNHGGSNYQYAYSFAVNNKYLSEYIHYYLDTFADPGSGSYPINLLTTAFDSSTISFTLVHVNPTVHAYSAADSIDETFDLASKLGDTFELAIEVPNQVTTVSTLSASSPDIYL